MKVHSKIQKWGNGLALRISGTVREIPQLKEGMEVDIEVTEEGFVLKKSNPTARKFLPYKELDLVNDLSSDKALIDLVTSPIDHEIKHK